MHIHASIDLGILAAKLALVVGYGLVALITAGIEAGVDMVDAAFDDAPVLGAPAPHDEDDGCWLPCSLVIDITPAASTPATDNREARFTR